jgi:hypothetical protein
LDGVEVMDVPVGARDRSTGALVSLSMAAVIAASDALDEEQPMGLRPLEMPPHQNAVTAAVSCFELHLVFVVRQFQSPGVLLCT